MVAEYARDHELLHKWESPRLKLKKAASQLDTLVQFLPNVMRIKCNRAQTVYPEMTMWYHGDAMRLDRINGDNRWFLSEQIEVDQLMEYEAISLTQGL